MHRARAPQRGGVGRVLARELNAWHNPAKRGDQPSVFVTGSLFLGEDAVFGPRTRVKSLALSEAPDRIARLYEGHGANGFAYLDGEFSIILFDPRAGCVYLVADKCGSHDIYLCRQDGEILFGSHPLLDPLWSTETLAFVHDGCEANRMEKVRRIAESPLLLEGLRVCVDDRGPDVYNCGSCWKMDKAPV